MEHLRKDIDGLYKWHLDDLIKNAEEYQELTTEIRMLIKKISNMKDDFLKNSNNFLMYLKTDEVLSRSFERLYVYSYLYHYQDMADEVGKIYKETADKIMEEMNLELSFVRPLLINSDYNKIKEWLKENKELEKYAFTLEKIFRYKKYTLSEAEEKIIALANNSLGASSDIFSALDNVDINLGFIKDELGKKVKLTNSNYIKYCSSKNRGVRRNAFKNMYNFFGKFINTIAACYIGSIKENTFSSKVRGYESHLVSSLYADNISVEFYEEFIADIHEFIPLLHKYMKVRGKYLGYKPHLYDVYVDLGEVNNEDIPYKEGIEHVKEALKPLGEKYITDLSQSFTAGWIDVYPNAYKRSGAYQWGAYGIHPYVSLNYENNFDSVATLAHELGHAMHSYYSDNKNTYNNAAYPIFLAEIASTVNEVLVDDYFFKKAKSDEEKIYYLAAFLDKIRTTIFRQVMFAEFETKAYKMYENNEVLTVENLCDMYYELNKMYFGKNVVVDDAIKYEWARIPHFYTPFYVYKYATGLIVALAIANSILEGNTDMQKNYLEFLASGGSDYPLEILKKCQIDLSDKKFIKSAFKLFKDKLTELEELVDKKVK